ncbi:tetratricopeptide repeat protein [Streptomyces sp. NPDC101776]|uniref:tetratricopeptide repeat protein n=1 Tax=Streptomyces sp. NPDC101776 TaxID=3366146 RepID=UPI00382FD3AD
MAPRETDNKPPEEEPVPPAAEREWERLWKQGEDSGDVGDGDGDGEVSAEVEGGRAAKRFAGGPGAERTTDSDAGTEGGRATEPVAGAPVSERSTNSGAGSESSGSSETGAGLDSAAGRVPAASVASGTESVSADSAVRGEESQATDADASAEVAADASGDADGETPGGPTRAAAESAEPTSTIDDAAPTSAHGNADEPVPTHHHTAAPHSHDATGEPVPHSHTTADGPSPHHHDHDHDRSTPHSHTSPDDDAARPHHPDDDRIAAVRRVAAAGRRWRAVQLAGCAALLAVAMTAGAIAIGAAKDSGATGVAASSAVSPELLASGSLDASIASLQAHLRTQPKDYDGWATLGLAYVEQARTKGDPSRYPQAQAALQRSLKVSPGNENAIEGQAALAAARHEFKEALTYADQVLKENPYSERALCSRIDALVELGRYADASKAADLADARKPGVPVFTRYAYVHELRGDVTTARSVLERALAGATSPGDISYVAGTLGQLAWNQGDYKSALDYYGRALAADENYLPALEGRARTQAALGDRAEAIKGMELVVSRYPLPQPLVELGELYESRGAEGDKAKADDQYALVDAWIALARANGVNADLDTALAAADHGDVKSALKAARAEWARRHTVHTADALAWALHVNGRDKEALPYARQATATNYHNASFIYHLGMIELATGHKADGRAHLAKALKLNPGFSPLGASKARKALEATK